jgi:hypothetical protein
MAAKELRSAERVRQQGERHSSRRARLSRVTGPRRRVLGKQVYVMMRTVRIEDLGEMWQRMRQALRGAIREEFLRDMHKLIDLSPEKPFEGR